VGAASYGYSSRMSERLDEFMAALAERTPGEEVFHQSVRELLADVIDDLDPDGPEARMGILERMTEPDRTITFRVVWQADDGSFETNRAHRVQFSDAIGPYKGGLRFAPSLNLDTLKFLGFSQTFKNALTGLPMGGAKGGADFDPKGRSELEVMRFCQALMTELHRHIGEDVDVPAGDIGVGEREIAFLFGQYKRINSRFAGVLTGKGQSFGGSAGRAEATGHGAAYFAALMRKHADSDLEGLRCALSGSGNVSIFCAEKLAELGASVISLSDSDGTVHDPDGIDGDKLAWVKELKLERRGRIAEYADEFGCEYLEGETPWSLELDAAFPCATQNELDGDDAKALLETGCELIVEGANMPLTPEATERLRSEGVAIGPAKAANAGGVAVSGFEQSQNAARLSLAAEDVDRLLQDVMELVHAECVASGELDDGRIDYIRGANRASFRRVRDAMLAQGAV
jgi:glutamate dehydrogenase (NADP+)